MQQDIRQWSAIPEVIARVALLTAVVATVLIQPEAGKAGVAEYRSEGPRGPLPRVTFGSCGVQQLTANSALVPDGSCHTADSSVGAPGPGCNAYTPTSADRELWGGLGWSWELTVGCWLEGGTGRAGLWPGSWKAT